MIATISSKDVIIGKGDIGVPTAVFHGLNDNCTNNYALVYNLSKYRNGAYVRCIEIGDGKRSTWWMPLGEQAQEACLKIKRDHNFMKAKEFNVIGFS